MTDDEPTLMSLLLIVSQNLKILISWIIWAIKHHFFQPLAQNGNRSDDAVKCTKDFDRNASTQKLSIDQLNKRNSVW